MINNGERMSKEHFVEFEEVAELVKAAQGGDAESFEILHRKFKRIVLHLLLKILRDHGRAHDVCQETFTHAWVKIHQITNPGRFSGWIKKIARNRAINHLERVVRDETALYKVRVEDVHSVVENPERLSILAEERNKVREAVRLLPRLFRETINAFYMEGLSHIEMSDRFEVPIGTIKSRINNAREKLRGIVTLSE